MKTQCFAALICLTLVTSCAQIQDAEKAFDSALYQVVGKPIQYVEDSIRGYRVNFVSIPAGASLTCFGEKEGLTPRNVWFDLTDEVKENGQFELDCGLLWKSGATAKVESEIPLETFPRNVHIVTERPKGVPGLAADSRRGDEYLAYQERVLQAAASTIITTAAAINEISEWDSGSNSRLRREPVSPHALRSRTAGSGGAIKWKWVTSGSPGNWQSAAVMDKSNFTPITHEANCLGSVVGGQCFGKTLDPGLPTFCVGSFINGKCIGSILFGD